MTSTMIDTPFHTTNMADMQITTTKVPTQVIQLTPIDRLASYDQEQGFWSPESFNSDLKLPPVNINDDNIIPNSLLFTFQGQAAGKWNGGRRGQRGGEEGRSEERLTTRHRD